MGAARLPTYFVSHGGGPWPFMKDSLGTAYDELEASIVGIRDALGERPSAVLVITAHWEAAEFTVSSAARPPMLYDYYGFPEHTYRVVYAAPGSPELAARVGTLLGQGGLTCRQDPQRGFDHGTVSVLVPLYPQADVPVVQLSLRADFDPSVHLETGRRLAPLRDEGVLLLGSGLSYHNLARMDRRATTPSREFDAWLQHTLVAATADERTARLLEWQHAPSARAAHPREDHLLPLMVAVGAAEREMGRCIYHENDFLGSIVASSFRFG